ncbi:hypothetical protein [Deinococcus cellulosilyticus]|uniref:Uncharacterized protein n=1 Tax=Deinococcus cellulosilyticus (strain DSM 18568 / NBRC 106333 / KACC 11606 / 5516J-15) TaxID=1223518 RepID=A0A511MXY7_DEIC1|nr:hypothetical protein [Deinococcus cellulosilyticus]GEM44996.1 hypothetical protein DC3_06310 [Deinococcus cellulosilyticus NBRC 106333 = KACC 11606]
MERDKRIKETMQKGARAAIVIAVLAMAALFLAEHLQSSSILKGFGIGLMVVLPVSLILMTYRGYQSMDEYGKTMTLKAVAVGFMVVMGLSMIYFPLEAAFKLPPLPLWVIWVVGSTSYGIAMGVQSRTGAE